MFARSKTWSFPSIDADAKQPRIRASFANSSHQKSFACSDNSTPDPLHHSQRMVIQRPSGVIPPESASPAPSQNPHFINQSLSADSVPIANAAHGGALAQQIPCSANDAVFGQRSRNEPRRDSPLRQAELTRLGRLREPHRSNRKSLAANRHRDRKPNRSLHAVTMPTPQSICPHKNYQRGGNRLGKAGCLVVAVFIACCLFPHRSLGFSPVPKGKDTAPKAPVLTLQFREVSFGATMPPHCIPATPILHPRNPRCTLPPWLIF